METTAEPGGATLELLIETIRSERQLLEELLSAQSAAATDGGPVAASADRPEA